MDQESGSIQFLSFTLDQEVFALEISKVREVLEVERITKVPQTPEFLKGVINLRGSVVPVVDLRLKFGLGETSSTVDTCIIIVEIQMEDSQTLIGALADSVQEVFDLRRNRAPIEVAVELEDLDDVRLSPARFRSLGAHPLRCHS